MCVTCGCGHLTESGGDGRHITASMLHEAARAANLSVAEILCNIAASAEALRQLQPTRTGSPWMRAVGLEA